MCFSRTQCEVKPVYLFFPTQHNLKQNYNQSLSSLASVEEWRFNSLRRLYDCLLLYRASASLTSPATTISLDCFALLFNSQTLSMQLATLSLQHSLQAPVVGCVASVRRNVYPGQEVALDWRQQEEYGAGTGGGGGGAAYAAGQFSISGSIPCSN